MSTAVSAQRKAALNSLERSFKHPALMRDSYDEDDLSSNKFGDYALYIDDVVAGWAHACTLATAQDLPLLLNKTIEEIKSHLFTCNYAQEAFSVIQQRMPMSLELYSAFIRKASPSQDMKIVKYLIDSNSIPQDQFKPLFRSLALKRSYGALCELFHAWTQDYPANTVAEKEALGDVAWKIIIYSELFTSRGLHPNLVHFIRLFEGQLKECLPLLLKNGEPLPILPDIELLDLMRAAGFEELPNILANSMLLVDDIYNDNKFSFLEQHGATVTEDFLKHRLSAASSEKGWKMAMSYYLQSDKLEFDVRSIHRPSILFAKAGEQTPFPMVAKTLIKALDVGSSSEIADKKRMALIALYVDGKPDLIKTLLKEGLPERYLEIGSIREEKLMLDLGI
jgi:hypothetical protein